MFRLVMLGCCLLGAVAFAGPAKKKAAPKKKPDAVATLVMQEEIKKALDAAQPQVGGCVLEGVEGDAKTWTQVVKVKVVINGVGQVLEATAAMEPANANAPKTKTCIEAALKAATYPQTHAPMTTAEREWTFAMQ